MSYEQKALLRFWKRVDVSGGADACWPWTGYRDHDGYGMFWYHGRNTHPSRFILSAVRGRVPRELVVRHSCDNPSCVNPRHLSVGTQADNIRDKVERGRVARGSGHGMSKLDANGVRFIREHYRFRGEWNLQRLADHLGVSMYAISDVIRGRTWTHVDAGSESHGS